MAFVWELTKTTIDLPLGCLQGGGTLNTEAWGEEVWEMTKLLVTRSGRDPLAEVQGNLEGVFSGHVASPTLQHQVSVALCYRLGGDNVSEFSANYQPPADKPGTDNSPQGSLRVYPGTLL